MEAFYKTWKKYNEIQLAKNKMGLNNRKMKIIRPPRTVLFLEGLLPTVIFSFLSTRCVRLRGFVQIRV